MNRKISEAMYEILKKPDIQFSKFQPTVNRQRLHCSHTNAKRLSWRKEASFISRTEINTVSESGNVECPKEKLMLERLRIQLQTEMTDSARMLKNCSRRYSGVPVEPSQCPTNCVCKWQFERVVATGGSWNSSRLWWPLRTHCTVGCCYERSQVNYRILVTKRQLCDYIWLRREDYRYCGQRGPLGCI
jgi:hypothetical protein